MTKATEALLVKTRLIDEEILTLLENRASFVYSCGANDGLCDDGKEQCRKLSECVLGQCIVELRQRKQEATERVALSELQRLRGIEATAKEARKMLEIMAAADPRKEAREGWPRVVCLCGSTRFVDTFDRVSTERTLAGEIVLSIGCHTQTDNALGISQDGDTKKMLDEIHLRKIDMADYVLVLNVGGYVGSSTCEEIEHAKATGTPVEYLEHGE